MAPDRKVLITGVAGFAGSNLAKALLARGYRVTGLDVVAPNHADLLQDELSPALLSRYLWKSLQDIQPSDVKGHSVVAHLAAQPDTPMAFDSPRYTVMQNVGGTVDLLEAVRRAGGVSKVLFAASGNETGRPLYLPIDEDHPLTPHNPYGFSKAAAELAMWAWHRAYGIPVVVLSNGVVAGPNMRREVFVFKWLWNALHGRPIVVEGGQQTRDLTYIDDVVQAWILAIEAPHETSGGAEILCWIWGRTHHRGTGWDVPGDRRVGCDHRIRRIPPRRGGAAGSVQRREGPPGAGLQPAIPAVAGHLPNRGLAGKKPGGVSAKRNESLRRCAIEAVPPGSRATPLHPGAAGRCWLP